MTRTTDFASAAVAHEQDPRRYPYGYLTGGSDELASVRVFVWFQTLDEMIESLLDVEPRVYGIEPRRGLEAFQARVRPILERLHIEGTTESLLREFAPDEDGGYVVEWWGTYSELRSARGMLGRELLDEFLGEERRGQLLPDGHDTAFIDFLRPPTR